MEKNLAYKSKKPKNLKHLNNCLFSLQASLDTEDPSWYLSPVSALKKILFLKIEFIRFLNLFRRYFSIFLLSFFLGRMRALLSPSTQQSILFGLFFIFFQPEPSI